MLYSSTEDRALLSALFLTQPEDSSDKIAGVKAIFNASGASKATQEAIHDYTFKAFATLEKINIDADKKVILKSFGENLMNRKV